MSDKTKKNWLAKHAKSSAALISLGIHILLSWLQSLLLL